MDILIHAAARALDAGDPIAALSRVALRDDPPALALRGIAMAQLGDLARARDLLRRAIRAFRTTDIVARARCVVADAEIALVTRDLGFSEKALAAARDALASHGDWLNAVHARHIEIRRLVLLGRLDDARRLLDDVDPASLPPAWRAAYELVAAGIAIRRVRAGQARAALVQADKAARSSGIVGLVAEVESAFRVLETPAARVVGPGDNRLLLLADVEALEASGAVIVDACRYAVRDTRVSVSLAGRTVLFALARAMAEAGPGGASRDRLLEAAFDIPAHLADETDRARLRVEIGRLRAELRPVASVNATKAGFALVPHAERDLVVLEPPVDHEHAALLAFLADGEAWSSSALALALGWGQRTVQRALDSLDAAGKVQWIGHGRARRWITPPTPGITTTLLLPTFVTSG